MLLRQRFLERSEVKTVKFLFSRNYVGIQVRYVCFSINCFNFEKLTGKLQGEMLIIIHSYNTETLSNNKLLQFHSCICRCLAAIVSRSTLRTQKQNINCQRWQLNSCTTGEIAKEYWEALMLCQDSQRQREEIRSSCGCILSRCVHLIIYYRRHTSLSKSYYQCFFKHMYIYLGYNQQRCLVILPKC